MTATSEEREKQRISRVSNSPDFNTIERIWTIVKRRKQRRRASEWVITVTEMKNGRRALLERLTVKLRNPLLLYFVAFLSLVVITFMSIRGDGFLFAGHWMTSRSNLEQI